MAKTPFWAESSDDDEELEPPRQVKDLCHNHDDAVTIGRVQDPVDGRCRVPFDTRAHASDAMNRINGDDGPVRATLVS